MPKDKSALEEFLGGLGQPKDNPFESTDPFADKTDEEEGADSSTTDEGNGSEGEEDDKPIPFHKDPKVLKFIEKEVGKRVKDLTPAARETTSTETATEDEVTEVLIRIIGNDTPEKQQGVKDLRRVLGSLEEKGAQRALQQLEQRAQEQVEQERQAQEELEESFESIEETYGVDLSSNTATARKTRSDFIEYIRKIAPKNEEGEVTAFPDLIGAYEDFQERGKRAPASRAKEIASRGMTRSSDASAAPAVKGKSWKDIDKLFNGLS